MIQIIIALSLFASLHAQMYDPFQKAVKMKSAPEASTLIPPPRLLPPLPTVMPIFVSAVMNEKAFINGAWYRVGESVNQQEVAFIQDSFVGLKEGDRLIVFRVGSSRRVLSAKDIQ